MATSDAEALFELFRVLPARAEEVRAALARVSVEQLVAEAQRHALGAVLLHELTAAGAELPLAPADALRTQTVQTAGVALRIERLTLKVLDALTEHGVIPVLLKGYGLASRFYPDPLVRAMTDVDLLIPPEGLPKAERALEPLNLRRKEAPAEAYDRAHHHHLHLISDDGPVELHFRALTAFGAILEGAPLYARSTAATLKGRTVRYLLPEDELVYLAAHAAGHLLLQLSWLYDIKLLVLRTSDMRWEVVVERARESRMQAAVFLALNAAKEAFLAPIPDTVLRDLTPPLWQAALFRRLFSPNALVEASLDGKWRRYATLPLLAAGPREMAGFTLHHLGRGLRRKVALRFPSLAPTHWRG
jgi:hypothetical protein